MPVEPDTTLEAELAVAAEREPTVRAWVHRHDADTLRAAWRDCPEGPLRGFTLGVKDIIDTADLPTECGSPIYRAHRPTADAAPVALARAAGALVTGKTVTTEFAYFSPGPTTNPHDPQRTPGGSSSGSAAAVAAGMVRVAFGTQTAGSVIRPASFCGVIGFKPTFDTVPLNGVHPLAASLDTLGWYGRTIDDVAAVLDALTPPPDGSGDHPGGPPVPPRLGFYPSHDADAAELSTQRELERVAGELRASGIDITEVEPLEAFAELDRAHETIMACEAAAAFAWERSHHADQLSSRLGALMETGRAVTAERYAAAQQRAVAGRAALHHQLDDLQLDGLLTFAAPGEAPIGLGRTGNPVFNRVWTMLRVPCLSLPLAEGPHGLPIGVQLIGRRWQDRHLLAVGRAVAAAAGAEL
jgi:Asp-tRNA(Asn)/Glu-tRNA(Gln) amidotransferase A subunit family amidase